MSAVITVHPERIGIEARFFFYGAQASTDLGQKIVDEIMFMWNEPRTTYEVNGVVLPVQFEVQYVVVDDNDIIQLCINNRDFRNNFVRIGEENTSERSMMGYGLGENAGHWLSTDNLGESTTAAHEFGHAMGLPHPELLDYRTKGHPPLMAPRGTLVDAEFQWDPSAVTGEFGGTMKPVYRKVWKEEVEAILKPFDLNHNRRSDVGRITNILFDEVGNPVRLL